MEKAKKFCRKKRSIAKSMLSLILVFAMVISNVQTSSGMLSTVWAAESESQTPDGEAETGSVNEDNDSEETGEVQESLDSEETNHEERSESTEESTQAGESERSEETSESGNTETKEPSSTAVETETVTATETATGAETETETELTEEESKGVLEEGAAGENPPVEQVNIKLHFKDVLGWKTDDNDIQVAYADYKNNGWNNDGDYANGKWPGTALSSDADGYYTLNLENVTKPDGLVFVFHNKNNDNGTQTDDFVIPAAAFSGGSAEYWIYPAKTDNNGKHFAQVAKQEISDAIVSPEIHDDNRVTFRYVNCFETSTVKVAGDMTSWGDNAIVMENQNNSGIFTATTDVLQTGEYSYKFILGENTWINDPNNQSFGNGGNNTFTISASTEDENTSPEVDGKKVTFRYENASAENVYVRGEMTSWDVDEAYKMTKNTDTGVHTLETELTHGTYEYKFFYVDGDGEHWLRDPKNELNSGGNDPNSVVYVPGSEQYEYTIHYYNPDAEPPTTVDGPDLHIWDKCSDSTAEDHDFTEITTDDDTEKGKTWLTATIQAPYPHINIIARPTGAWVDGTEEKEWTYELKNGARTAELWLVYGDGLYDTNPYLKTYKYTVHYYNPAVSNQEVDQAGLFVWGKNSANAGKHHTFTDKTADESNDINWLTATVDTPYKEIGLIGKQDAGDGWNGKDETDRFYQIKGEAVEAELWYVHGVGVYDEKPVMKLDSVVAALSPETMDYTQNSVLSLVFNGNKDTKVLIKSASVDASALGISDNLTIDPQL